MLELISEFTEVAGYNTNAQNLTAVLCTCNDKSENETKEQVHL